MRVQVFQHVPIEDLGAIRPWLAARGARIDTTRFFEPDPAPPPADLDLLVVLGGPMSVNDTHLHPWLEAERGWIGEALAHGTPLLGVCLGAQLMARALGARVYPNTEREIGWWPIEPVSVDDPVFKVPASLQVFHWHGETFDLPEGAVHLARSAACAHQAFRIGARAIGLQFHVETTPDACEALIEHCPEDLRPGTFVQSEAALRATPPEVYDRAHAVLGRWLGTLIGCD